MINALNYVNGKIITGLVVKFVLITITSTNLYIYIYIYILKTNLVGSETLIIYNNNNNNNNNR